jgi:hypothetical protein
MYQTSVNQQCPKVQTVFIVAKKQSTFFPALHGKDDYF